MPGLVRAIIFLDVYIHRLWPHGIGPDTFASKRCDTHPGRACDTDGSPLQKDSLKSCHNLGTGY